MRSGSCLHRTSIDRSWRRDLLTARPRPRRDLQGSLRLLLPAPLLGGRVLAPFASDLSGSADLNQSREGYSTATSPTDKLVSNALSASPFRRAHRPSSRRPGT